MIVIIAGTRGFSDMAKLERVLDQVDWSITEVVSGAEPTGVDRLGERWAGAWNPPIPVRRFPADWSLGPRGGPVRNEAMAQYAAIHRPSACILIWDGKSRGTKSMLDMAIKYRIPTLVHFISPDGGAE